MKHRSGLFVGLQGVLNTDLGDLLADEDLAQGDDALAGVARAANEAMLSALAADRSRKNIA